MQIEQLTGLFFDWTMTLLLATRLHKSYLTQYWTLALVLCNIHQTLMTLDLYNAV